MLPALWAWKRATKALRAREVYSGIGSSNHSRATYDFPFKHVLNVRCEFCFQAAILLSVGLPQA